MKVRKEEDTLPNSTVNRRQHLRKKLGLDKRCPICPPHGGENSARKPKTDRYKSERKGRAR